MIVDIWCALNSSFGGPLLALLGLGGLISLGRSVLLNFPDKFTGGKVGSRADHNRFRFLTLVVGWVAMGAVAANVLLYIVAFGAVRTGSQACPTAPLTEPQCSALVLFYTGLIVAGVLGLAYSIMRAKLGK